MYRYRSVLMMALCLLLAGMLCGCAMILERDYVFEEMHASTDGGEDGEEEILELTSYDELREALLGFIENHAFAQTVRLTDYTGDVERDVQQAVRDTMATPLGAFAVTNIAYQSSRILSYYELRFDISYRRTAQEIDRIAQIRDIADLKLFLKEKMAEFSGGIVFKLEDYSSSKYDFESLFMNIYYSEPTLAYGFKSLETHFYPESGAERIVEINVSYVQQPATLTAKSATATDEAQIILDSYIGSQLTANRLKYFYDTICSSIDFDAGTAQLMQESEKDLGKSDPFTVYGALIKKKAVGEGYALALKQLCDMTGIECMVVSGKLDGAPHMWNLVLNRGEWNHIDCSADAGDEVSYSVFGETDEGMAERYTWDRSLYPEAASPVLREMLSLTNGGTDHGNTAAAPQSEENTANDAAEQNGEEPQEDGETEGGELHEDSDPSGEDESPEGDETSEEDTSSEEGGSSPDSTEVGE